MHIPHRQTQRKETDRQKHTDTHTEREAVDNILQLRHVYVNGYYIQYMHVPHIYTQREDVDIIQIKQT